MTFSENLKLLFIHGGRNELIKSEGFLDDMHVLHLDIMVW